MVSSPLPKRWGDLNFEKLKSLGGRVDSDNDPFFQEKGKSNFHCHIQRKNSFHFYTISSKRTYVNCSLLANAKRVASSHEKLYNER